MSPQDVVFVLLALVGGLSAIAVVVSRNVVHAALFLAAALGAMAGVFLVLHAEFVAMVQLLVYVGAIAVLLLFGLMLTRAPIGREALDSQSRGLGLAVSVALFGVLAALIWQAYGGAPQTALAGAGTAAIGRAIFSHWVLPFEVVSMLLLAALMGAIVLARRETGESGQEDVTEQRRVRPDVMGGPEGVREAHAPEVAGARSESAGEGAGDREREPQPARSAGGGPDR